MPPARPRVDTSAAPRRLLQALALLGALASPPASAELAYAQVRALPPLPESYFNEPALAARLAWLQRRLAETNEPAEQYRTQRLLFREHFQAHQIPEAAAFCVKNAPLREDLLYREECILATVPGYQDQVPKLLELVHEARQMANAGAAALILKNLAWQQSQAGDIAGAFENFEAALSLAPSDDAELMGGLMMDTAAAYIVNGDEAYIKKGVELLRVAHEQMARALADPQDKADKEVLKDSLFLSEFNRGIAYILHLGDNEKALQHFDRVTGEPNAYREDALAFAALAAAELKQFARAKKYLALAEGPGMNRGGPVVRQYLSCYRQLAERHWNPGQSASACLALKPDTAVEVQLDVYKRLSASDDAHLALAGLKGLRTLFLDKLEPQLRRRGSTAASNAELKRLQRESELKSVVLKQQEELQRERDATNAQRQNYFVALSLLLLVVALLVALQWRAKKKLAEQYERLSVMDALTQLGNRRYLEQHIERELAAIDRLRRTEPEAALGFYLFDIDHFKSINDRFGHGAGDEVLVTFSRRIQAATRESDLLVRWGGEEFLLVARLDHPGRCSQIAERILQAVNRDPFKISGHPPIPVTCTIGAALYPFFEGEPARQWAGLVGLADQALYEGKSKGRNRWVVLTNQGIHKVQDLEQALAQPLQASVAAGWLGVESP